jgi:uncharacterized protein (DUF983 family)
MDSVPDSRRIRGERRPIVRPPIRGAVRDALRLRCPNCRRGRVLARWPNKMQPRCAECGLTFFRESGYYIGGMIITYLLTIGIVIPVFLLSLLLPDAKGLSDYQRFGLWILFAIPVSFLLMPYAYSLWLSLDFWLEPWPARGEER